MKYFVNIESLHRNFPSDWEVPSRLLEFADWLKEKSRGSLGYFRLESERFDDHWIENGADLHSNFAFFICDSTGGRIGYWLYDGVATQSPPIVLVGSEGEAKILAGSFEEFLRRLAAGNTGAPDLDSRDDGEAESKELKNRFRLGTVEQPVQPDTALPDLSTWMEAWGRKQRDAIDNDVDHQEIANRLRKYLEPGAQPWECATFDVLLVGSQFKVWHRSFGMHELPRDEVSELERPFRSVREERARVEPKRGLWFSAWVRISATGGAVICCNFMDPPEFLNQKPIIPAADYDLDLRAFPRSKHWMPEWMK